MKTILKNINILVIVQHTLRISSLNKARITTMKLFYAVTFLIFVIYIQSIGFGINIYGGVFNFSLNHQSIETFYYLVGAFDKNL
jgi:hypothetical protein